MEGSPRTAGHVFLSYAHEDSPAVDELQGLLESAGIPVWRDTADVWPGEDWRSKVRNAISSSTLAFIACFSARSQGRAKSYQNEELTLAIEELRLRSHDDSWLIPVRLDDCEIPNREIGGGRTLRSLHHVDLFGPGAAENADRLIAAVRRILGPSLVARPSTAAGPASTRSQEVRARPEPAFGIITALPEEFVAMKSLIDHPERRSVASDRADYVVGTMPSLDPGQPHTVVLTMLGETGNDAASSACSNLVRSFGSVRCVLMVGIAAGMPNPREPGRHVRLGDIVVARWGIAEYDSARDTRTGPVPRRTFPPASPLLERRARMLDAHEIAGVRPWEEWLGQISLDGYQRPPASADRLYASDDTDEQVPHPDMALSGHRPGWPKVHCGVIASGDRSLRSARKRDEIAAAAPDVLAIEMEGKGIGNTGFSEGVEWLVVRGISDYGDHHVTRTWRKYASLVAAAYTRALLAECAPLGRTGWTGQASQADDGTAVGGPWRRPDSGQRLSGSLACGFPSHSKTVLAAGFSPDGTMLATVSADQTARLWRPADGTQIRTLAGHAGAVDSLAFSPDGELLATASEDGTARLWELATGSPAGVLAGHTAAVWRVSFSPAGGMLATASYDRTARLWRTATAAPAAVLGGHQGSVLALAFSPDGNLLATASDDGTARLWNVADGEFAHVLDGHGGPVWQMAFSPDGTLIATASADHTARTWHTATGAPACTLTGHDDEINAIAFSPDGTLIATASADHTARIWDSGTGAPACTLTSHVSAVWLAAFSPDGLLLATADEDGIVKLWEPQSWPA